MNQNSKLRLISTSDAPLKPEQVNHLLRLQRDILESIALSEDSQKSLDALCSAVESLLPNAAASIMLIDETGSHLDVQSAPSIPAEAIEFLNGLQPGPEAGSCGTAVFKNEAQFVNDTRADPRWKNMHQFATDYNICACWSMPIRAQQDKAIGSLALSSFEKQEPTAFHLQLLETAAYLASIILEREREKKQLWHIAHFDTLTSLPNRYLFNTHLEHAIVQAERQENKLVLLILDLDSFKDINDTLGHLVGDEVLKQAATIIKGCLRKEDLLARLGGDEFVLLLGDITNVLDIQSIVDKIIDTFREPIKIHGDEHLISTSIGVSVFPDDATDLLSLQKHADIAMYAAKSKGPGRIAYYQPALTEAISSRITMAKQLRLAIGQKQLFLNYQPQYCTKTGRLAAVEVLLRWLGPDNTLIPPLEFIPVAEDKGLIVEIGEYVTRIACQQCVSWWRQDLPQFTLSINLSVKQLQIGYARRLLEIIEETQFPTQLMELEVTESLLIEKGRGVMQELDQLKAAGISIAMDDFGKGHSSLGVLKHLPISKLKIDQSFVRDIPSDPNDKVIARTIIAMGHTLGLKVVAEGVETKDQREFLSEEGCDLLQGYLLGKPLSADKFESHCLRQAQTRVLEPVE